MHNGLMDRRSFPHRSNHHRTAIAGGLGMIWLLVAMIPVAIGGGMLQPTINSLITKRVSPLEIGGMLGISAAFLESGQCICPAPGRGIFQATNATVMLLFWGGLMGLLYRPGPAQTETGSRGSE